jgi:hypothetical protein
MPLDLATAARRADGLTHRQRLLAAERLAAGDPLVHVAMAVGTDEGVMRVLDVDDSFRRLVDACRDLQEMPREAYRERAERLLRGAAERAIADGRVSTVNLILRATRALEDPREEDDGEWRDHEDDYADGEGPPGDGPLAHLPAELLRRLTREQLLDCMLANDGTAVRHAFRVAERAAAGIAAGRRLRLVAAAEASGEPYDTGPDYAPVYERAAYGSSDRDGANAGPPDTDPAAGEPAGTDANGPGVADGTNPSGRGIAGRTNPSLVMPGLDPGIQRTPGPGPTPALPAASTLRLVASRAVDARNDATAPAGFGPAGLALPRPGGGVDLATRPDPFPFAAEAARGAAHSAKHPPPSIPVAGARAKEPAPDRPKPLPPSPRRPRPP